MSINRRQLMGAAGGLALAGQGVRPAMAQDYPRKGPIKIVVATGAGGGSDALARIAADFLQRRIGQPVFVENRPGASGAIGIEQVSRAPADGYTLLFQGSDFSVLPAVRAKLPYKPEDFTFLLRGFSIPTLILGAPSLPANSVPELIAHMKAHPGRISYGSSGQGGVIHLAIALLESAAGVRGNHIPYSGIGMAYQAMLGGHVDFAEGVVPFPPALKVLGVSGTHRHPAYPQIPTLQEQGIQGASWDIWYGFMAPPNLPKPIQSYLTTELTAVLQDPAAIEKFKGSVGFPPNVLVGEQFKDLVLADAARWKKVAAERQIVL
jgi:tripartite-type tricarboxylate transporter receptor subunit TctC